MSKKLDTSVVLTDSVVDDLMDDWFERDGETFIKKRTKDRLGWEKTLKEGESYSSYLLEAPTKEDLIKRAYSLARETIISMNPPFKVHIKISTGRGSSYTDGKVVCVNTDMFDDEELSVGERLDTFLGVTVHEGCHLLYTKLELMSKIKNAIIKNLWNIIEDEGIEQTCGERKPGLANFLEKSKYYYFDKYYLDYVVPREKESKLTPFDRIMNLILYIVRYPKYLKESEIIEFGHYLLAIKKVLTPFPSSTEKAIEAAEEIYEIIRSLYKDIEKDKHEGESSGDGESSDEDTSSSDAGKSGSSTGKDGESESEISSEADKKMEEDSKDFLSAIAKAVSSPKSGESGDGLSSSDLSAEVKKDGCLLGEVCEGLVELGSTRDTFFSKEINNEVQYRASLERVKKYIPSISKIMKGHCREYKLIHRSMRSGLLDTGKLAEAYQGVPSVYMREGEVRTDKISVCVLIDESGSMCLNGRINAARDAAVLINEGMSKLPNVELFMYGHSGDIRSYNSTELYIYKEKGFNPKFSIGSVRARRENRDGVAILEVAKRVRKQTKNPILMFILSDGAPAANGYGGERAMKHVKECVEKVEKMNFKVIQVCIDHSYDPSKMFKNYVIMDNMSTLAVNLGKAIKKATMDASKVHVI